MFMLTDLAIAIAYTCDTIRMLVHMEIDGLWPDHSQCIQRQVDRPWPDHDQYNQRQVDEAATKSQPGDDAPRPDRG